MCQCCQLLPLRLPCGLSGGWVLWWSTLIVAPSGTCRGTNRMRVSTLLYRVRLTHPVQITLGLGVSDRVQATIYYTTPVRVHFPVCDSTLKDAMSLCDPITKPLKATFPPVWYSLLLYKNSPLAEKMDSCWLVQIQFCWMCMKTLNQVPWETWCEVCITSADCGSCQAGM